MLAIVSTLVPVSVLASGYSDDPEFVDSVNWMYDNGLTRFSDSEDFMPGASLTREQGAKFLVEFANSSLSGCMVATPSTMCDFSDLDMADPTLAPYITQACEAGLMKGSNGMFMPKGVMSRAQFFTVLIRALEGDKNENVDPRWDEYFSSAASRGITTETDTYAQGRSLNRYQAALMLYRSRNACNASTDDLTDLLGQLLGSGSTNTNTGIGTNTTTTTANGDLTIARSATTPGVQYVPGTSTNIRALKVTLTAGSADAVIKSLNVKLAGLVSRNNIDGVYVTDTRYMPLTNVRSFGTDYKANLVFLGGLTIPANTSKDLFISLDTSGSINERFVVSVDAVTDVVAGGTVGGTFPIVSNEINTTQYVAPSITFTSQTNVLSTTCTNKYYIGDTNKQIGRFTLQSSNTNRGINIYAVRLRTTKALAGIVNNLKLSTGSG